jgi:hypothetical protein
MKRVPIPTETEWQEIRYHPKDIITRIKWGDDKSWEKEIPGCKIEHIPEDLGFMKYLTNDIKVRIIYPEDAEEMYVEPLAKMHNAFWDCVSEVIYSVYPFPASHCSKNAWKLGGRIHGILARIYWDNLDYKKHTPQSWANTLNNMLTFIENNKIKKEEQLETIIDGLFVLIGAEEKI